MADIQVIKFPFVDVERAIQMIYEVLREVIIDSNRHLMANVKSYQYFFVFYSLTYLYKKQI